MHTDKTQEKETVTFWHSLDILYVSTQKVDCAILLFIIAFSMLHF